MMLKPDAPSAPSEQDLKAAEALADGWSKDYAQCLHFKRLRVMECKLCLLDRIAQDRASLRADLQREREQAVRQALETVAEDLEASVRASAEAVTREKAAASRDDEDEIADECWPVIDAHSNQCIAFESAAARVRNRIRGLSAALGVQPATPAGKDSP